MVASFKIKLTVSVAAIGIVAISLASCGDQATLPVSAGAGAYPQLPSPNSALFPTVNIAPAKGWTDNAGPVSAPGLKVATFADGLDHPRWLYVLPNGDVLVAETNAPPKPEDGKGIKGWFMRRFMSEAGATSPTANRITLLRDADGDGVAETHSLFLRDLNSPFGMALVGDTLYVANTDAVMKYPYKSGETLISDPGIKVADLPAGPINHHWTKSLIASRDGEHLYVGVGSNSNAGENGIDKEDGRAAIWEIDPVNGAHSVFASGLRNPVGLAWEPVGGNLWAVVNERDELGSDLVPDYLTSVKYGGFYGWPYSYFGANEDPAHRGERPDLVQRAIVPDMALGAHVAALVGGEDLSEGACAVEFDAHDFRPPLRKLSRIRDLLPYGFGRGGQRGLTAHAGHGLRLAAAACTARPPGSGEKGTQVADQ